MNELSPTMKEAIEFAKQKGGSLVRHPGGFWAGADWTYHSKSFGTTTIEAIVTRGAGEYTEWKQTKHSRFPIKMTVKP